MHKKWMIGSSLVFCVIAILVGVWWFFWGRFVKITDDAYVHGNQVYLTPQIEGYVTAIYADDTMFVQEGQVLVELDKSDRILCLEQAKTELANAVREVTKLFETVYVKASEFEKSQADLVKAEMFYIDRKEVVESGAISEEEFIQAESAYYSTRALFMMAKYNLMRAISDVEGTTVDTHPLVEKAKSNLREAFLNLKRCTILSPVTGIVAKRNAQVGEAVFRSAPLLVIIPAEQMWVEANFKEIELSKIRIGQKAKMVADIYGRSIVYEGEVIGIGMGSGAVFSPLPPQNATGNWIKIVQRVPVRISLNAEQLATYPLRLGLSIKASIDVHNQRGKRVADTPINQELYNTNVFDSQLDGVDDLIFDIIAQNKTFEVAQGDGWKNKFSLAL